MDGAIRVHPVSLVERAGVLITEIAENVDNPSKNGLVN